MKISESAKQVSSLLLVALLLVAQASAQQKQATPTTSSTGSAVPTRQSNLKEEEITFDTLLAAKSYKLYGEVRMIGGLARSNAIMQLLEPLRLLGTPPKEVTAIIEFLNANAEMLATSRLMFATMPARAQLPQNLIAIELASAQDAIKFEPEFRTLFTSVSASTSTASPAQTGTNKTGVTPKAQQATQSPTTTKAQPVFVKRAGGLILASDTLFNQNSLRPDGSQPLSSDPNFQRVRSRFVSEPLFLYFDVNLAQHAAKAPPTVASRGTLRPEPPQVKSDKTAGQTDKAARATEAPAPVPAPTIVMENTPPGTMTIDPVIVPADEPGEAKPGTGSQGSQQSAGNISTALPILGLMLGGGEPNWPEAVGVAALLDGDELITRALLVNAPGAPSTVIPFFPALVSGPEIAPRASTLSPAATDIFVSVSVDPQRVYDTFLKEMRRGGQKPDEKRSEEDGASNAFENQIADYEQALGFKIKEDLLGALGNEVAVNIPTSWFKFGPNTGLQKPPEPGVAAAAARSSEPGFVVFISLNDKERVREMLPRALEVFGLKAPGAPDQVERRASIEIKSYGPVSLAFIDDFLVVSPDVTALRAVVDAHENNQTLASNPAFKTSTGWQSARVLGQVYLSSTFTAQEETFAQLDDKLQDFLSRFNPKPGAITHAVFNDHAGLFHELHLPKDWVALMIGGLTSERPISPMVNNEANAVGVLMNVRSVQTVYKAGTGKGSFATRDQLISENLLAKQLLETEGYRIEMTVTNDKYEVTATPTEYGKTGRRSFYMDESGIIRGADHVGQPATVADKPL